MAATRSLGSMQISIPGPTKKYPGRLGRWKYPRVETSSVPSESTDTIHVNTELDELRLRYIQLGSKYIKLQEEKELREKESLNQVRALEKVLVKNNKQLQQARATYVSLQKRYQEQCTLSEMYRGDLRAREERIRSLTDEAHMFETEIIRLRSENEQHPKHRDKVDPPGLPISGLKQVVAGEGMTTHVKCTCLASELNLSASATNLDTSANSSAEDQPVSVLANTRDANTSLLTFDDVSAGKQTHQITLSTPASYIYGTCALTSKSDRVVGPFRRGWTRDDERAL
ncbi:hypothetical protein FA15DRAFT_664381 [Coprinopsis marcescibilis]|uniref:Uncharacterized protein n=1 Tax=Coprinopsis marcescibilis TaxID=230819 RepID=A0A5C3L9A9_COPMA|nr:hypothetical protein FA15DRAFT_664381 [Coprinopsis marcescibilis]